jgi:hypothetical protein
VPSLSIVREVRVIEYEFVYHADVRCYWCGHEAGVVTSKAPFGQPGAPIAFRPRRGDAAVVRTLAEIRCARCNGPVFADNPDKRRSWR